ncbi:fibroleukin-like [Ylistrum balloti]|uniref:fibroleukin-like n=1 Tax=Ylistrum balloti TaxID=509963 RepID=UPI002905F723|nr:fibroleukin-like [Ylistrum balloti]
MIRKGVPNPAICAKHCDNEECHSFSFTNVDKRCETYSRSIVEDKSASAALETWHFSKIESNEISEYSNCSKIPHEYPSGVYKITTAEGNNMEVYCDMDSADGPWTVIQRRISSDVDFYRTWTEYKNGFGNLNGNFWIGNDILNLLTPVPRILRVELTAYNGTTANVQYSQFQVANEDQNYRIFVTGFSGTLYDAMENDNGFDFTTFDRDNDIDDENCGVLRQSGWWHKKCTRANLNGGYPSDTRATKKVAYWVNFPDPNEYFYPLKGTLMMIR